MERRFFSYFIIKLRSKFWTFIQALSYFFLNGTILRVHICWIVHLHALSLRNWKLNWGVSKQISTRIREGKYDRWAWKNNECHAKVKPAHAMQEDKTKGWLFHWVHKKIFFWKWRNDIEFALVKRNKNEDVTSPFKRASSIINYLCNLFQSSIRGSKKLSWKEHM